MNLCARPQTDIIVSLYVAHWVGNRCALSTRILKPPPLSHTLLDPDLFPLPHSFKTSSAVGTAHSVLQLLCLLGSYIVPLYDLVLRPHIQLIKSSDAAPHLSY